ncbi:MAG: hypothetical protein ABI867_20870 [Kofleriaceae bacterium]
MSYNLYAEGDFDMLAVARVVQSFGRVEVFPITCSASLDAIGIAIPLTNVNAESLEELDSLLEQLLAADARVFDLYTGERIVTEEHIRALHARLMPA